ncbi:MAG: hypothetical protein EP334_10015 [Gammaproteobacteria bacterium]|nr:MAG: hypothetical protein EP334_10015 [Gammaproteobacteria bacterium]
MSPIRIFIGSADKFRCCEEPLCKSILAHSSVPVEFFIMRPEDLGVPPTGCTGFSNLRYAVPELAGYAGFAIYLDVDMLVLGDIAELYEYREAGRWVQLVDGSNEVSVISCGTHRHMPSLPWLHTKNKHELKAMTRASSRIPLEWNVEDHVQPGMKLLHFTDLKCQPWFNEHPCREAVELWNAFV